MAKQQVITESLSSSIIDLDNIPSMEALLEGEQTDNTGRTFAQGAMISGKVVGKSEAGVLIDIGYKAEGLIPRDEFPNFGEIEEGQSLDVYIEVLEDEEYNMPLLSARKAEVQKSWDYIVDNYEEGALIKGIVRRRVRGGLIVDVGVDAFLPGSQVDVGPVKNLEDYVGNEYDFKILKISADRRNIVLSRREILEEERAGQRAALLEELQTGQIRRGMVKNITDFGAFIDLNGMDGLLHITDMSWGRISHPSEMVKVGDDIEVMVLDIDHAKQRVSLGLKQKEGNPWDDVELKFPVRSRINGRVVNVMPYGAFVELEEGVEGLIHVSEMSWTKRINKASDVLNVGDEVEAVVLDVQKDAKKISLGLRQTTENPWEVLADTFPRGSKIKGKVRNMTSYGAFVQIQDDIDGMIHVSDMSWTRKINHPSELLEKGEEVEAVVLDIDPDQQRISLGLKQLSEDPWANIESHFKVGDVVKGNVTKITSFGAFVQLENDIEGLLHISQLSAEHVKRVKDVINVGDEVTARVVKIDAEERRIGLSIKAAQEDYMADEEYASGDRKLKPGEDMVDMSDLFHGLTVTGSEEDEAPAAADVVPESSLEEAPEEAPAEVVEEPVAATPQPEESQEEEPTAAVEEVEVEATAETEEEKSE